MAAKTTVAVQGPGGTSLGGGFQARLQVRTPQRIDALNRLPKRFHRYFETSAGTFNWRHVKRTQRQSMHSFAIAIDLEPQPATFDEAGNGFVAQQI